MATATQIEPEQERTRGPFRADDERRSRAFTRARRHSAVVRALKIGLPVVSLVMLASYGIFVQHSMKIGEGKLTIGPMSLSTEVLTMHAPRYEGFNKDGGRYVIEAKSAVQDLKLQNEIKLNEIDGKLLQTNNATTTLSAVRGNFDTKANELELFENITIKSTDGMSARLTRAKVYIKENRIVSEEPVDVTMTTGTLRGNSMVLLQKSREVTFSDGVVARLNGRPKSEKPAQSAPTSAMARMASSDQPVDITSPQLKINDEKKTVLFSSGVRAVQGDAVLTASELEALYEGGAVASRIAPGADAGGQGAATPRGAPGADAGGQGAAASRSAPSGDAGGREAGASRVVPGGDVGGQVKRLIARGNLNISRGADRVVSDVGEFDTVKETSTLTGSVVFKSGADRQASADRADIDQKAETILLTGDVTVVQGKNMLKGRRLFVDQKNGTSQLSSPPDIPVSPQTSGAPNRITARLYQNDTKGAKPRATAEAGPLKFNTDPTAPVDIEAEVLDANDAVKTATFRGNVVAIQGDFKLRTSELTAIYTGNAGLSVDGAASEGNKTGAQVQKIQARKKVIVTSKDDQSATGDWADFDVKANTITLGGDVVLNQARNIARGPKLVIDMVTGQYRMETGRPANSGAPTANTEAGGGAQKGDKPGQIPNIMSGSGATACGGRMCLLVYPKEMKDAAKRGAAGIARTLGATKEQDENPKPQRNGETPDAASSWNSTIHPIKP